MLSINALKTKMLQNRNFKILIVVLVIGAGLLFLLGKENPAPPPQKMDATAPVYDVTKALDDKSYWVFKAEQELKEQQQKQEQMGKELDEIKTNLKSGSGVDKSEVQQLQERIQQLEQALEQQSAIAKQKTQHSGQNEEKEGDPNHFFGSQEAVATSPMASLPLSIPADILSESLSLNSAQDKQTPHIDHYIPAGSYAKAVLLSGVDVSAGVSSQSAPKPVLLRLIHKGSLPNKAVGKMKDCRIVAAAYGDLSSERAYMRLEKLSCIEPDGHVIETDVDGYISGEDGKNGVRGRVVIRDAEVLKRGFMGGLLSGLGKATSQSFSSTSVSPFGSVNTSTAQGADIFKQAGSQGAGDAFELMAKYNIQRAEQYQPVVQISAGRVVDVVFHSGSQFGEKRRQPKNTENNHSIPNHFEGD